MAELEAEHKARQQGATRWREAKEFANLLDLADVVDIQTAAEGYTGQQERGEDGRNLLGLGRTVLAPTPLPSSSNALDTP